MSSTRQILADIFDLGLDPTKAYTHTSDSGRISKTDDVPETPLGFHGQSGLFGWWPATGYVNSSGAVSQCTDASGNSNHLTQASGSNRPPYTASDALRGLPAMACDGVANKGVFIDGSSLASGSTPTFFVVASRSSSCPSLAPCMTQWISGSDSTQVATNRTSGGFFGYNIGAFGVSGGKNTSTALDTDVPHLFVLCLDPVTGHWTEFVDGVIGTVQASGNSFTAPPANLALGGFMPDGVPNLAWGGNIYDAWVSTGAPTASQLARALHYSRAKYRTP